MDLPGIGDRVAGKYEIVGPIGEGGMAVVLEATHVRLSQSVAIKFLMPEMLAVEEVAKRFEREGRALAQLRSINSMRVLDVDSLPNGVPYIVAERLFGSDLASELAASRERMSVEVAVDYVSQACSAMAEAHALGIVHRDLKPANLFLCEIGECTTRRLVKVLDFGISKMLEEGRPSNLTVTKSVFGTPEYMSPEQVRSSKRVDARTDVWSLGVILYESLTGRTPFNGSPTSTIAAIVGAEIPLPRTFRPTIPAALEATIMKALAKDPNERFQCVEDFMLALEPYGPREPVAVLIAQQARSLGRASSATPIPPMSSRVPRLTDLARSDAPPVQSGVVPMNRAPFACGDVATLPIPVDSDERVSHEPPVLVRATARTTAASTGVRRRGGRLATALKSVGVTIVVVFSLVGAATVARTLVTGGAQGAEHGAAR